MKVHSMEIDDIKAWQRPGCEKVSFPVMFAVAVGALFFAMREINNSKAAGSPVPSARHGARQFFPQNIFAFLFPQQLAHVDLQDGHAPTFYPPPPPLPKSKNPDPLRSRVELLMTSAADDGALLVDAAADIEATP